ncbi:head-tail adaptor protein [Leisingera sp. SS27]|uniref:head-tail adaptor protein n=1 Tax=Leisingera sp. SS27 TaxID=2979462 RepID=UPI00232E89B8|nr:head-tail adaptor protein [Leisingera sp. SS27]MDC0656492.1 head-tail adaptor protein [Leisingera sp. SS27]
MKRPPNLTRKLVLEDPQRAPDGAGGYTETWVALGTLWAEVKSLRGRLNSDSLSLQKYRITLRASPDGFASRPRPDQRFRDEGRLYRIDAVTENGPDARYLTCFAVAEVSA